MSWWRSAGRIGLIGACWAVILTLPWILWSQDGQNLQGQVVSSFSSTQSNTPVLKSWPYFEVVVPEDENIWPYRVFRSSPITPPNLTITLNRGELADGYLFMTPGNRSTELTGQQQDGPFIIGTDNELVYRYDESDPDYASHDFRVQKINGEPRLVHWHGSRALGHGFGSLIIMDAEYQETRLRPGSDAPIRWMAQNKHHPPGITDFHENQVTSRGTILVSAYNDTVADLTSIGGHKDSAVVDSLVMEIDIKTGEPVFTWSALDHLPITASKLPLQSYMGDGTLKAPWDHFHINSIQDLPEGILVGGRHTWAVYLISRETGEVIWTLDGSGDGSGDFAPLPDEGQFRWQHHVRIYKKAGHSMYMSIFDNHYMKDANHTHPTRGLLLELPSPPNRSKSPRVIGSLETSEAVYSDSQGSVDTSLSNGNVLVGYGPIPIIREFSPAFDGMDLRWEARFGNDNRAMSYRVHKCVWHATPRFSGPSLVLEGRQETAQPGFTAARAYVSWNGATDVDTWKVYVKEPLGKLLVGQAAKRGFETVFDVEVPSYSPCLEVAAVQDGSEIRFSNVVCL